MLRIGMTEGWSQSLDRLEREVTRMANPSSPHSQGQKGSIAPGDSIVVKVKRTFDSTPENVFDAWLDAANVGRWLFATPGGTMVRVEIDPQVGGEFTIVEQRGDILAEHFGRYIELVRPRRLVFAFTTDKAAKPSRVTIEISPLAAGCELTLTHEIEAKWLDYVDRVHAGWTKILEGLGGLD